MWTPSGLRGARGCTRPPPPTAAAGLGATPVATASLPAAWPFRILWPCPGPSQARSLQCLHGFRPAAPQATPRMKQPPRRSREFANAASSCEHLAFCRRLPKVELSAHLNGCVRDSTLRCGRRCCGLKRSLTPHFPRGPAAAASPSFAANLVPRPCHSLPCRELASGMQLDGKPVCLDGLVQLAEESECCPAPPGGSFPVPRSQLLLHLPGVAWGG